MLKRAAKKGREGEGQHDRQGVKKERGKGEEKQTKVVGQ
jgi:hypothetical protein